MFAIFFIEKEIKPKKKLPKISFMSTFTLYNHRIFPKFITEVLGLNHKISQHKNLRISLFDLFFFLTFLTNKYKYVQNISKQTKYR